MLARAVGAVSAVLSVRAVVVAVPPALIERARAEVTGVPRPQIDVVVVGGGAERQDSVRRALEELPAGIDVALVHDAARPFASVSLMAACIRVAGEKGAAVAALPVHDTVKEVAPEGRVRQTLERRRLWRIQTPQAFCLPLLRAAHQRAVTDGVTATDDAALVEHYGGAVWIVPGEATNVKITTAADLAWARWLVARGEELG